MEMGGLRPTKPKSDYRTIALSGAGIAQVFNDLSNPFFDSLSLCATTRMCWILLRQL